VEGRALGVLRFVLEIKETEVQWSSIARGQDGIGMILVSAPGTQENA
jgi:hypothetical protein